MKFPSFTLHDVAFAALTIKMIMTGGSIPEAVVAVAIVGAKAYQMFLDKKVSLQKTEDIEKRLSSFENKLLATGLVRRPTNPNV